MSGNFKTIRLNMDSLRGIFKKGETVKDAERMTNGTWKLVDGERTDYAMASEKEVTIVQEG